MEILHDFNLFIGEGQSLCLIGLMELENLPFFTLYLVLQIFFRNITIGGKDITNLTPNQKLSNAGIAYILQDKSVFPQMTVEENLLMGGF